MGWHGMGCAKRHLEQASAIFKLIDDKGFPILIAKPVASRYICSIPDIVMSNNTGPEYGSEGEESYVRTSDAQGHCRLVG